MADHAPHAPAEPEARAALSGDALGGPTTSLRREAARRRAIGFIILIGLVSLFADATYEGGRSVAGPFLAVLGASGTAVGFTAGAGELAGYATRFFSARLVERSGRFWRVMAAGYLLNLLAVPLLALAPSWPAAVFLFVLERFGRGVRAPIRDAMLSHAASQTGAGWGFGLHEALDQTGAIIGPLLLSLLLAQGGGYRLGFALLLIPAAIALALLALARHLFPDPRALERIDMPADRVAIPVGPDAITPAGRVGRMRSYRLTVLAAALIGAGFADFALIAFHLARAAVVAPPWVPILYAVAMAADGAAALAIGWLFDRLGMVAVLVATLLAAAATPLVFLGDFSAVLVGVVLWGIGLGAQESVLKSTLAASVPAGTRARAFGTFDALRGVAWFAGSLVLGGLYDVSIPALVAVSVGLQLAAAIALLGLLRPVAA
jgi:MFS family permease